MVLNVFLAILVLSIIVIVHEFGHFIIAKANGITVVEFSIGFGPKLIHFRKGETEYCIKALPFGGACTMLGDEFLEMSVIQSEEDNDEELTDEEKEAKKRKLAIENGYDMEKSFASKSVWARIAVIAAGPVFNFLLAFVCAVVIVGSLGYDPCDIDVIKDNSPATEAGLQEGDVITKVNGHKVTFYRDFYFYRAYNADKTLNITFTRDGEKMTTTVTPQHIKQQKYQVGIMMNENCLISSVTKDSPAEKAGLKANDVIKAVDGTAMENSSSVTEAITSSGGSSVTFTVARDGKNANSALLVNITVEDYFKDSPLDGMYFQEDLEKKAFELGGKNYNAPAQRVEDFIKNNPTYEFGRIKPTYMPGVTGANLNEILPEFVSETMKEAIVELDKKLHGFADKDAVLTGVETRSSSPVQITRDKENLNSTNVQGLYPCGEGAGYAGGITSAAMDGLKVAEAVSQKYMAFDNPKNV